jgi:hypothetical protein
MGGRFFGAKIKNKLFNLLLMNYFTLIRMKLMNLSRAFKKLIKKVVLVTPERDCENY